MAKTACLLQTIILSNTATKSWPSPHLPHSSSAELARGCSSTHEIRLW